MQAMNTMGHRQNSFAIDKGLSWRARALGVALLVFAHPAFAQVAFVQSTGLFGNPAGITAASTAFAANPKVGDTIVVLLWTWSQNTAPATTVSDSAGNTYTSNALAIIHQATWYESAQVFSVPVASTGAAFKVTVNMPGNDNVSQIRAVATEYSGVGAVDKTNAVTGTSATAGAATTTVTSYANELVVSAFGINNPADNFTSIAPSSGYTTRAFEYQNSGDTAGGGADRIISTTGVQSNTWTVAPTLSGWAAVIATFSSTGSTTPDHFAISDAGTAVNCQASPVTITAHSATHTAVSTTATITVSTSTAHGDWSLATGAGAFAPGAANSGTATYTYVTADSGAVTLSLKDTYAETVTINVVDGSVTQKSGSAIASEQPSLSFVSSGFRITNGGNVGITIATQVAAKSSTQSLALQAVRTDTNTGACTAVFASGATLNVSLAYQCNNPASCVAGQTLGITNNSITTNIASNPNSGVSTYTPVPLKFSTANAEAPFSLSYSDVGQVTLYARYFIPLGSGSGSGNTMTGSSQFVVQPYNFSLTNIRCTTYGAGTCSTALSAPGNNPGAPTAAGAAFIQAGQPFAATVTAKNFAGSVTPNYGQEIAPPGVTLSANLVAPVGGNAATLNNGSGFGSFSGGIATGTTFNWPEVGIITLTPSVANYLGSGAVTGTASGDVGRFMPNGFTVGLNTPVFGTGCAAGAFSYLGQPLTYTVPPVMTVTALAAAGSTTGNYTGAFLKLTNSSLTGRTYAPTPANPTLDSSGLPSTAADPAITDLGSGRATLTFSAGTGLLFTRGAAVAPFSAKIALSINVIDSDGVAAPNPVAFGTATGISFSTSATQYYGRLALRDAVGSELLDLPMALTTQYYLSTNQGFTINTGDSCTVAPSIALSNYQLNLTSGKTCVRDSGSPGVSGAGCAVAALPASAYKATASSGNFNLVFAAPGSGFNGAMTATGTAPAWLQYVWNSAGGVNTNPAGIAAFGVFSGQTSRVYQREVY
jgi:MSHA biogenesis protein MshQ